MFELNTGGYDDIYLEKFCKQTLEDYFIISAKIADHLGHIIASAHTPGLIETMSPEETERAAVQAAIHFATRDKFKSKIGDLSLLLYNIVELNRNTCRSLYADILLIHRLLLYRWRPSGL
jgi:hypothetical protein